ncbi:MAG TPA: helix-turn-helix domain-containing protein, partial [Rhizobacter sp.]|nr:helix-turn-helix domain-containing protein [Rhizobacter sp.]
MSTPLERSFNILELLAAHPEGQSISVIASSLDVPLSATHRLLAELS